MPTTYPNDYFLHELYRLVQHAETALYPIAGYAQLIMIAAVVFAAVVLAVLCLFAPSDEGAPEVAPSQLSGEPIALAFRL